MNDDIKDILFAWGDWARTGNEQMGYKNNWDTIFSLAPEPEARSPGNKKPTSFILDSQAARIDRVVSNIKTHAPIIADVLKARYVDCMGIEAISKGPISAKVHGKASKKCLGKHKVRELLAKGEGMVEGALISEWLAKTENNTVQ